jgi:hypothetical protein
MKIMKPEKQEDIKLNMIVYALTGGGKTHFCGTAAECPDTSPMLYIDVGGGSATLAGRDIDMLRPKNMEDLDTIYKMLLNENTKWKCVCLDGLTAVQAELSMAGVMETAKQAVDIYDLSESTPPRQNDWMRSSFQMKNVLRGFRDLAQLEGARKPYSLHVIMTALEKQDEKREIVCPSLPGVLGIECGAYVDVIARLSRQLKVVEDKQVEMRHMILDEWTDDVGVKYIAKNRGQRLGKAMWEPTVGKIIERWNRMKKV